MSSQSAEVKNVWNCTSSLLVLQSIFWGLSREFGGSKIANKLAVTSLLKRGATPVICVTWSLSPWHAVSLGCGWRIAVNILNKQSWTASKW
jgi:hypothetical protein